MNDDVWTQTIRHFDRFKVNQCYIRHNVLLLLQAEFASR